MAKIWAISGFRDAKPSISGTKTHRNNEPTGRSDCQAPCRGFTHPSLSRHTHPVGQNPSLSVTLFQEETKTRRAKGLVRPLNSTRKNPGKGKLEVFSRKLVLRASPQEAALLQGRARHSSPTRASPTLAVKWAPFQPCWVPV